MLMQQTLDELRMLNIVQQCYILTLFRSTFRMLTFYNAELDILFSLAKECHSLSIVI